MSKLYCFQLYMLSLEKPKAIQFLYYDGDLNLFIFLS